MGIHVTELELEKITRLDGTEDEGENYQIKRSDRCRGGRRRRSEEEDGKQSDVEDGGEGEQAVNHEK